MLIDSQDEIGMTTYVPIITRLQLPLCETCQKDKGKKRMCLTVCCLHTLP